MAPFVSPRLRPNTTTAFSLSVLLLAGFVILAQPGDAPAATRRADLKISAQTVSPTTVVAGGTVTASVTVYNQGTTSSSATTIGFWITKNPSLTPTNSASGAISLRSVSLGSLAAKAKSTLAVSLPIPSALLAASYYIQTMADSSNLVAESNEGNNLRSTALAVTAPQPSLTYNVAVQPGDDLATLVAANPEGTIFVIKAGVHRFDMVYPKNGDSFVGELGAVLSGARLLTSFAREGSWWVATGQTQQGQALGSCQPAFPACAYPEDLFIDDVMLQHVSSPGDLAPGKWHFDYANDKIYLANDPMGHRVETSVTRHAFYGSAGNVTIRNLVIEKYASPAQHGAIHAQEGSSGALSSGWIVDSNEIRWNHGAGLRTGHGMKVLNNVIRQNGQLGIRGFGDNVLVEGNEIAQNNLAGFDAGWEAGGTKFSQARNLIVRKNNVHDNYGPGLWTDYDNIGTLYESNQVANNANVGIFHEISYDAIIRYNTVSGNGLGFSVWLWGAGILIAASPNVEIYGNTVTNNADGIAAIQQNRGAGSYGPFEVSNLYVHGNTISIDSTTGLVQDIGDTSYFTSRNNRFQDNTYQLGSSYSSYNQYYAWMDNWRTKDEWISYGMDVAGVWIP